MGETQDRLMAGHVLDHQAISQTSLKSENEHLETALGKFVE